MIQEPRLRGWLQYAGAKGLLKALGALPRPAAVETGRFLGRCAYSVSKRLRKTGQRTLRVAFPEMAPSERDGVLRRSFDSIGRQLAEFSQFPKADAEALRRIVEFADSDLAHFEQARSRGKGLLFVTAHLGAWELLVFAYSVLGEPVNFVARPIANRRVEDMVRSIRCRCGNQSIDKTAAGLSAARILRKGGTLGVLADVNALPQEGVFVPFFRHLACTTAGIAALALQADATVLPVFAPWVPQRNRYVFQGGPILETVRSGDHRRDVEVNTARLGAVLESWVRRYPDQWLWIHDRWRARPRPGDRVCTDVQPA